MNVQHLIDVMPAFLLACVILAVLPGPATALFLHRSVRDGRGAGLAAVVGNEIVEDWEGCLSIPDIRGKVPRAIHMMP